MILRARIVLPVSQPPIANGAVQISGNRIAKVAPWNDLAPFAGDVLDLGDLILLPGLVNAHCHLDYTNMAGRIPPQKSFVDWIHLMLAAKAEWTYADFAESWVAGAQMLLRTGTTTVADFEAVPELLPDAWSATPLRVTSLLELTGVKSRRDPRAILDEATARIESLPSGRNRAGLAPHAPYSTVPDLTRLSAAVSRAKGWPLSVHVAESAQEFEMFTQSAGVMFDWLRRNERDMTDCGHGSPIQQLARNGVLGGNLTAVHVNYLAAGDAALLAENNASVAHCPRSHFYFQHREFPLEELLKAGVNICLGTDSLATVYRKPKEVVELSMFEEMSSLAGARPSLPPKEILRMATLNGARALGLSGQIGELSEGALADLIAVPFSGKVAEAEAAVAHYDGNAMVSLIDGAWAIAPNF